MAGSRKSIQRLLERHKLQISRELEHSGILAQLVKKGVVNHEEESKISLEVNLTARADLFVEVLSKKGFNAFREMCNALELECPHLLTSLLLDSTGKKIVLIFNFSSMSIFVFDGFNVNFVQLFNFVLFSMSFFSNLELCLNF